MEDDATTIEVDLDERPLSDVIREVEARYLSYIMTKTGGNKTHAAKRAGMELKTFRRRLENYTVRKVYSLE